MQRDAASRGRRQKVALAVLLAALAGCGTVLPPLEESDGSVEEDTGAPSDDATDDDADPPSDDDAGEIDVTIDALDVSVGDGCTECTDARGDGGMRDVSVDMRVGDVDVRLDGDVRVGDGATSDVDGASCPTAVDCALPACNGVSCGTHGQICKSATCACPGGQTKETTCGDKTDNDCDGLTDCADPDCAKAQCGTSTNQRCCGTTCVDTETDPANCQGCGLACASGQTCKRISDNAGTRGHCTCAGTSSQCPKYPGQICRVGNGDGQDNLCACDLANQGNSGCADGQVCADVAAANFCHY